MSGKLQYFTLFLVGGLIITQIYIWSIVPQTKQDTNQTISRTPAQEIVVSNDAFQDRLKAQLTNLQQQFTTEQIALHEQLNTLQEVLQAHIDEREAELSDASAALDSWSDMSAESSEAPVTTEDLNLHIAKADFSQEEAVASQLNAEEADPHWSGWAEAEVRAAIETDTSINAQLINVECRSSFCRVDGEFGDSDVRGQLISKLMALVPWEAQAFYHGDELEGVTGALYIMKEGATEPQNRQY
jgi:hypothetical protein